MCTSAHNRATARTPAAGTHELGACSSQLPGASENQSRESPRPASRGAHGGASGIHPHKVQEDFMSTHASPRIGANDHDTRGAVAPRNPIRRLSTETKAAFKDDGVLLVHRRPRRRPHRRRGRRLGRRRGLRRPPGLAVRHDSHRWLHGVPRPGEVRQQRPVRRRRQQPVTTDSPSVWKASSSSTPRPARAPSRGPARVHSTEPHSRVGPNH